MSLSQAHTTTPPPPPPPVNPILNENGSTLFTGICTVETSNGDFATITISNPATAGGNPNNNTLTVTVAGAPPTGIQVTQGTTKFQTFNQQFSIATNDPTQQVVAEGNFGGANVTIANTSSPAEVGQAAVVTASS